MNATQAAQRLTARQPLVDDVHAVLVDMLMNHALEPGSRLNIDSMARNLGVSPTPVREALARMEAQGLVVKEPRRSYIVAPLIGLEDLRALIDFRLLIEPAAAAAAALNASPDEATALQTFARSGGSGDQDATSNRLDMVYDATFHDIIAKLSNNSWLRESLLRARSHLHMYRLYHHAKQAAATKPEHVAIARAIAQGDPDAAAEAMRTHLTTAMRRIDDVFASGELKLQKPR
ncbi:GntR family transcriptional regulator [Streptosporangiaceae bacterium NEAU-GS5]|nr:GntR family transcriptional regulator [Streptosporangiaceae bacterium NEAU-GS5]